MALKVEPLKSTGRETGGTYNSQNSKVDSPQEKAYGGAGTKGIQAQSKDQLKGKINVPSYGRAKPAKPLTNKIKPPIAKSVPKTAYGRTKNAPGNPSFIESPKRYYGPPNGQMNK